MSLAAFTAPGMLPSRETSQRPGMVLISANDRVSLTILECLIAQKGHEAVTARSGDEALDILKARCGEIDAIFLDYEMPVQNGGEIMRALRQDPRFIGVPLILQSGHKRDAIPGDYFYYVPKPIDHAALSSVLEAALRETRLRKSIIAEMTRQQQTLSLADTCRFHLRTLEEAENLAGLLANAFPDPNRTAHGLADLLINAIEHGNLQVGHEEKTRLLARNAWRDEVMRRANLPEHREKCVEVILQRKKEGVFVQITDAGKGFDWQAYLTVDPSRAADRHGRGIAHAAAQCFDDLRYNSAGNQVTVAVYFDARKKDSLAW